MVWVLLAASAAAVLLTGLIATALVLGNPAGAIAQAGPGFWAGLAVASGLTIASLMVRSLRWIFLLRRSHVRIPIRDGYIGYLAGLSLLFTPFLLGEIGVRAAIHRARRNVPVGTTVVVNLWERLLDLVALAFITAAFGLALGRMNWWTVTLLAGGVATLAGPVRRLCLRGSVAVARPAARRFDVGAASDLFRLADARTWGTALAASVVAWILPGIALWWIAAAGHPFDLASAIHAYASSSTLGGLVLAPGGVLVAGGRLLNALDAAGFPEGLAALSVVGVRLATVGVATMLGAVFVLTHLRTVPSRGSHFDAIADAYDVQIPESRREALLTRKTGLMREVIDANGVGPRGLDVGCGQGWYVARMRRLGFDVDGLDTSAGQVQLAERHVGVPGSIAVGSALSIPAADASFDFAYTINVLHHLSSVEEQRQAFGELLRVLRPGGLLFVHEINTRNLLFRFYMGYVFPSLNCIDEGVERWLLPHELSRYTDAPVIDVRYFTFLPDFIPEPVVRLLAPIERRLEASSLRKYSAHYMAVLRKAI